MPVIVRIVCTIQTIIQRAVYWSGIMKPGKNKAPSSGEDYRFMQERIKRRPVRWRKITRRISAALGMGLLFGVAAAFALGAFGPVFSRLFEKEQEEKNLLLNVEENTADKEQEEKPTGTLEKGTADGAAELLQNLESKIYQIAEGVKPFLVDVMGIRGEPDWFEEASAVQNQSPGIIIHMEDNILILTNRNAVNSVNYIRIRFCDGAVAQGHEIAYDTPTNLSVIQVDSITQETREAIRAASFRGEEIAQGELVLALGRPLGKFNAVVYGHVAGQTVEKYTDAVYRRIYTDIAASAKAQGILINEQGQVFGLINQNLASEGSENLITALGTLELRSLVEKLMRGENPAYLGIEGENFAADRASVDYKGEGIYVTKVKKDFPAMEAGIQGGDILTQINGKKITNMAEFQKEILSYIADDRISVTLMRFGRGEYKEMTFEVELGGY